MQHVGLGAKAERYRANSAMDPPPCEREATRGSARRTKSVWREEETEALRRLIWGRAGERGSFGEGAEGEGEGEREGRGASRRHSEKHRPLARSEALGEVPNAIGPVMALEVPPGGPPPRRPRTSSSSPWRPHASLNPTYSKTPMDPLGAALSPLSSLKRRWEFTDKLASVSGNGTEGRDPKYARPAYSDPGPKQGFESRAWTESGSWIGLDEVVGGHGSLLTSSSSSISGVSQPQPPLESHRSLPISSTPFSYTCTPTPTVSLTGLPTCTPTPTPSAPLPGLPTSRTILKSQSLGASPTASLSSIFTGSCRSELPSIAAPPASLQALPGAPSHGGKQEKKKSLLSYLRASWPTLRKEGTTARHCRGSEKGLEGGGVARNLFCVEDEITGLEENVRLELADIQRIFSEEVEPQLQPAASGSTDNFAKCLMGYETAQHVERREGFRPDLLLEGAEAAWEERGRYSLAELLAEVMADGTCAESEAVSDLELEVPLWLPSADTIMG